MNGNLSGIPQPREIGAHRAADQYILLKVHGQTIVCKEDLQHLLCTADQIDTEKALNRNGSELSILAEKEGFEPSRPF